MLPVPSSSLIYRSTNYREQDTFLTAGLASFKKVVAAVEQSGMSITRDSSVLEWGCGCGRMARHFSEVGCRFFGIDIDKGAIEWCKENLEFGTFDTCELLPPTNLESESFDLIYAGSVITHLSVTSQLAWMKELFRLLKPNGRLLLTFHGGFHFTRRYQQDGFKMAHFNGGLVAELGDREGSNDYAFFQTREATRELYYLFEEQLSFQFHGILGGQDTMVFSKPQRGPAEVGVSGRSFSAVMHSARNFPSSGLRLHFADDSTRTVEIPNSLENQYLVITGPLAPEEDLVHVDFVHNRGGELTLHAYDVLGPSQ